MGYRQSPLIHSKEKLYLHKSNDIEVYTEYVLGINNYRYQNEAANDTFIVVEGEIELIIDDKPALFHKGAVIEIERGTLHGPVSSESGAMLIVIHRRR